MFAEAPAGGVASSSVPDSVAEGAFESDANLSSELVERFSRQIIVDGIDAEGMYKISRATVLCVGCGGLGSTALLYLAAAGVGELILVDGDTVEMSNLHRQVIHTTESVGSAKVESAARACRALNPCVRLTTVAEMLHPGNSLELVRRCDVVVDATDNVAARYLINDAAARGGRPLVSASAIRWEGQLSVYLYQGGPCYRCLFPTPPPLAAVGSCSDTGVVGPVPGMMGCLQALEALKIISGAGTTLSQRMLVFDGLRLRSRVVQLRGRQPDCAACGSSALDTAGGLVACEDYVPAPCASGIQKALRLADTQRCTVEEFHSIAVRRRQGAGESGTEVGAAASRCATIDVRAGIQYRMAHLRGTLNVPLQTLRQWTKEGDAKARVGELLRPLGLPPGATVFVICRRGIASVDATEILTEAFAPAEDSGEANSFRFVNVTGGLNEYHRRADSSFPFY